MRCFITILLIGISCLAFSQEKYEKETKVDVSEVPENALKFVESYAEVAKFKWFKEESFEGVSYEAKGKINGQRYSVEFGEDGILQDIEVKMDFDEIESQTGSTITSYLESNYKKHKLVKVQIQYAGDLDNLTPVVDQKLESLTIKYEIVLYANNDEGHKQYEMLFSASGKHEKTAVIVTKNLDHFEH